MVSTLFRVLAYMLMRWFLNRRFTVMSFVCLSFGIIQHLIHPREWSSVEIHVWCNVIIHLVFVFFFQDIINLVDCTEKNQRQLFPIIVIVPFGIRVQFAWLVLYKLVICCEKHICCKKNKVTWDDDLKYYPVFCVKNIVVCIPDCIPRFCYHIHL